MCFIYLAHQPYMCVQMQINGILVVNESIRVYHRFAKVYLNGFDGDC